MATAITIRSESADYYTRIFGNHDDVSDLKEYLKSLPETSFVLIGYDTTDGRIMECEVINCLVELEDSE